MNQEASNLSDQVLKKSISEALSNLNKKLSEAADIGILAAIRVDADTPDNQVRINLYRYL